MSKVITKVTIFNGFEKNLFKLIKPEFSYTEKYREKIVKYWYSLK